MRAGEHERAAAASALDALLAGQLVEGAADRDEADAVLARQLPLGRNVVALRPAAVVDRAAQVQVDLVVERDGPRLEPEPSQTRLLHRERFVPHGQGA